jgi:hypothetical protein
VTNRDQSPSLKVEDLHPRRLALEDQSTTTSEQPIREDVRRTVAAVLARALRERPGAL